MKRKLFTSEMVSKENHRLFSGGWAYPGGIVAELPALVQRVLAGKKAFASVVINDYAEEVSPDITQRMYNLAQTRADVTVSKLRVGDNHGMHQRRFELARVGAIGELFDLETLASAYTYAGLPAVAEDITRMTYGGVHSKVGLSMFFNDNWDWQHPNTTVEPWITGLILGYPVEDTMRNIYNVVSRRAHVAVWGK